MDQIEGGDLEVDPSFKRGEGFDLRRVEGQRADQGAEARLDAFARPAHPALPVTFLSHVLTLWGAGSRTDVGFVTDDELIAHALQQFASQRHIAVVGWSKRLLLKQPLFISQGVEFETEDHPIVEKPLAASGNLAHSARFPLAIGKGLLSIRCS